jgi:hypothetical protein
MTLVMIGILTFTATAAVLFRRAVEEERIMWRLDALRNALYELAYENRMLLRTDVFWTIERSIAAYCEMDTRVLLEVLRPVFTLDRQARLEMNLRQQALEEQLGLPQHAEVAKLYDEAAGLILRHLLLRHLFLSMMAAVTLVGVFGIWTCGRWVSRRIVSSPMGPDVSPKWARTAVTG